MSEVTVCICVLDFCRSVLKILKPIVVPRYTPKTLRELAASFKAKHDIPYIIGAIDGSHIPIIAPHVAPHNCYNRKGFYFALLQGIVDTETRFWDWDFGWAGSLHDYTLFKCSREGLQHMAWKHLPYKLIGDAAYPCRTSMYVPFKGSEECLEPYRAHWNFIQSSTWMFVGRAFGLLKSRWRILLRRCEMSIMNTGFVVGACIYLHNLCIMHKDFGDDNLLEEARQWLRLAYIEEFGDLKQAGTMSILDYGKQEINRLGVEDLIFAVGQPAELEPAKEKEKDDRTNVQALENGVTMHVQLARLLYDQHLKEKVLLPPGYTTADSDSPGDDTLI